MILTEDEAKQRWCPQARSLFRESTYNQQGFASGVVLSAVNRDTPGGNIPACIASHCMFWRWAEEKKLRDIDLVTSDVVEIQPRLGYCGAAGTPLYGD